MPRLGLCVVLGTVLGVCGFGLPAEGAGGLQCGGSRWQQVRCTEGIAPGRDVCETYCWRGDGEELCLCRLSGDWGAPSKGTESTAEAPELRLGRLRRSLYRLRPALVESLRHSVAPVVARVFEAGLPPGSSEGVLVVRRLSSGLGAQLVRFRTQVEVRGPTVEVAVELEGHPEIRMVRGRLWDAGSAAAFDVETVDGRRRHQRLAE